MTKLYKRSNSKNWYANLYIWNERARAMVRKRIATSTDDKKQAIAFVEGLEAASKSAKALAGQTITKDHAHSLFISLLSTAGISIDGDKPLPLLRDWLEGFMEWRRARISVNSLQAYTGSHRKFLAWLDSLKVENPKIDWLTSERVEEYYAWLRLSLAVKTSREHSKWLGRAMKRAVEKTDLLKNPVDGLELDRDGTTLDRLPFTLTEASTLIEWLSSHKGRKREWGRCAALSLMSGCRLEDAITMDQSAISDGVLTYKQSKTGKTITCPLVAPEWLSLIIETGTGPVSPALHEEFSRIGNANLSAEFTGLVSAAGIEQKVTKFKSGREVARKTFHSLRHTLRTAIVSTGGSDAQADIILGHSEGEGKRYTHSEVDAMRGTLEKALTSPE